MKISNAAAVFPVSDLDASLRYFVEVLGFEEDFRVGDYAGIKHGGCCLHLSAHTNPNTGESGTGSVYVFCDEVDAYHAEITRRGAAADGPPQTYDYGMRDFIVRDPDGNQLSFGAPAEAG
ncbi:MAG: VOC family protein [Planctomycetota bacterium]